MGYIRQTSFIKSHSYTLTYKGGQLNYYSKVTYEGEVVLDSFAGSDVIGEAGLNMKRNCILIEAKICRLYGKNDKKFL